MTPNHQQAADAAEKEYEVLGGFSGQHIGIMKTTVAGDIEDDLYYIKFKRVVSPPAASTEQASDGPCLDCGEPCEVWFAPNELWNAVMPERAGLLCLRCFVKRANPLHINKGAWMLRTDPVFDSPPEQAAEVEPRDTNLEAVESRLRAVSEALEQADAYCPTCAHNKNAGHADGCDEAGWIISDPTIFNQLRAIVEGK